MVYLQRNSLTELILLAVVAGGPYSVVELAEVIGESRDRVYGALGRLVKKNLVDHPSTGRYLASGEGEALARRTLRSHLFYQPG